MRYIQDTFETRKRSFISAFSICMTVPLNVRKTFTRRPGCFLNVLCVFTLLLESGGVVSMLLLLTFGVNAYHALLWFKTNVQPMESWDRHRSKKPS